MFMTTQIRVIRNSVSMFGICFANAIQSTWPSSLAWTGGHSPPSDVPANSRPADLASSPEMSNTAKPRWYSAVASTKLSGSNRIWFDRFAAISKPTPNPTPGIQFHIAKGSKSLGSECQSTGTLIIDRPAKQRIPPVPARKPPATG